MNNSLVVSGSGTECPVCYGTGWELYVTDVDGYGSQIKFARRCGRCSGTRRLQDKTNVPPQFYEADLSKFRFDSYSKNMDKLENLAKNFFNKFREWEKFGKGLYIWSKTAGSGKTYLSCSIGKSVMMKYDLRMRFTPVPDYLALVGASYKREQGAEDESQIFRECDLLIFDDMGAQKSGEWQEQEIFRIVNERLNAGKVTIYTSNMPPEDLNVNERVIDRIMKTSVVIQMPEESIRRKRAREEQEDFLNRML